MISHRPKGRWLRRLLIESATIAIIAAVAAGGILCWKEALQQPGPLVEGRTIVVPRGGARQLADALEFDGVISHAMIFRAAAWVTRDDGTLHAGEFAVPAHASVRQVLAVLRTAHPVEHHLTIPEGLTARQIAGVLAHAEAMTGEVDALAEGSVLPETYAYEYGADRTAIVARAEAAMDKELAAAWADRHGRTGRRTCR
jgi:UPF0755 protein